VRGMSTCREDSIFNTTCNLWTITTFRTLFANRLIDPSAKFVCASQPVAQRSPWSAELWIGQKR
jgi:hypothetical protein